MDALPILAGLPVDCTEPEYTKCFDPTDSSQLDQALSFFQAFGFVVFKDIFTATECAETRQAMWSILEEGNPNFDHSIQSTWVNLKSKGSYGLSMRGPSFHPVLVGNR